MFGPRLTHLQVPGTVPSPRHKLFSVTRQPIRVISHWPASTPRLHNDLCCGPCYCEQSQSPRRRRPSVHLQQMCHPHTERGSNVIGSVHCPRSFEMKIGPYAAISHLDACHCTPERITHSLIDKNADKLRFHPMPLVEVRYVPRLTRCWPI